MISACVRRARASVVFLAVAVTARCGSSPVAPAAAGAETLELRLTTARFRLFAGRTSATAVQSAADALERQYARVLNDLNVTSLGPITVQIWQDEATYYPALDRFVGVHYQANGYITGQDELRVLAVPQLGVNVVREFCHAVSLSVKATFANNPRWLWETVALYENGELVPPRTLDRLMRRILVDFARSRGYQKRGGGAKQVSFTQALDVAEGQATDVVALNDALEALADVDERKSRVVELRFFGGLSVEETAKVVNVSRETVKGDWTFAKMWL